MTDKVMVLGTEYSIAVSKYTEEMFERSNGDRLSGYCDRTMRHIAICDMTTFPGWENETIESCRISERQTLRHEIVHAFLNESGLHDNTHNTENGWARNEEMVDWFANQGPKIYKAWEEAGALDKR